MARSVKGEPAATRARSYDASGRQEQARRTRARILEVARRRFLDEGYAATTIGAIAEEAGVSVETVYKGFGNKPGVLKAVFDVAIAGDDEPIPLQERDMVARIEAERDPAAKLAIYGAEYARRAERAAPVQLLVHAAAATDAGAADVWTQLVEERLTGMTRFATHLHESGSLRPDVSIETARDVLWAMISPHLYEMLVMERGWAVERFGGWIAQQLQAALV
jgi:AcrR family transcriptional regulator